MADGGDFDPCECIFNHEMAMRRLLSLLRQSQGYCTDNECFQDGLPGPENAQGADSSFMMFAGLWMMMAFVMYLMRPQSMRNRGDAKPQGPPGGGSSRDPDPPGVS